MSSKRSSKNRKKKGKIEKKKKPKSAALPPVELSLQEATLIYELMHDVKVTYMSMTDEEKSKGQVKSMLDLCNGIMKKVEVLVIGSAGAGEGKKDD